MYVVVTNTDNYCVDFGSVWAWRRQAEEDCHCRKTAKCSGLRRHLSTARNLQHCKHYTQSHTIYSDHETLPTRDCSKQVKSSLKAKYCPRVSWRQKTHSKTHVTLTFDLRPWYSIGFQRLSRYMFEQNFIKLSAAHFSYLVAVWLSR